MKVHVLVEGKADPAFVEPWARRAFAGHSFTAHPHQGKGALPAHHDDPVNPRLRGLLDLLPATLRAYGQSAAANNEAILVLVDADDDNCIELKRRLVALASDIDPCPPVVFRIAVEESEAFYLGDLHALRAAFPTADMQAARRYENDSICGTAELFGSIVGDDGLNKVAWAERMAPRLTTRPGNSRSPSFRALHAGIRKLLRAATPGPQKPKKKYRHVARTAR